jgi:hypothetical protein
MKHQFSPFQVKNNLLEPTSLLNKNSTEKLTRKPAEYNFHLAIISSTPYKELHKRCLELKEQQTKEK